MKKKILVVGLNPAWQKILIFEDLLRGKVNRALDMVTFGSGKGANFAKISVRSGHDALLAQFAGGHTGDMLIDCLQDTGIEMINQRTGILTRTCMTLISSLSEVTELIEPSGVIPDSDVAELLDKIIKKTPVCDAVAICGTFPPGVTIDFYVEIAKYAKKNAIPVIVDSYKGIMPLLEEGIDILKINRRELAVLSEEDDVRRGGEKIVNTYPIKILAVTDGGNKAYLFVDDKYSEHKVPFIENVVNPIGAGDTVSAVLLSEYLGGTDIAEAFTKALSAGSDSCRTLILGSKV